MHQRGAASLHPATWVAMLKQALRRSSRFDGTPTAVPQQDDGPRRDPLSRTKNIFYGSYINYGVRTVLVQKEDFKTPARAEPPTTSHSPLGIDHAIANAELQRQQSQGREARRQEISRRVGSSLAPRPRPAASPSSPDA